MEDDDFARRVYCILGVPIDDIDVAGVVDRIHRAASSGATVVVASNVPEQNAAVAAEAGARALAVTVDVRSEPEVRSLVGRTVDELGNVTGLADAAGDVGQLRAQRWIAAGGGRCRFAGREQRHEEE